MLFDAKPKAPLRVVITGASSGIGAATAIAFARDGARLLLGARGEAGLEDIARRCRDAGGTAEISIVDVTDAAAVQALAAEAEALLGGIDVWFSNVGVGVVGRYDAVPIADHRRVVEANLLGHMYEAHAVLPIFLRRGRGTWINMISAGGFFATPHAAAYAASKFGLRGFGAALRAELSKQPHIHVCDVYPTFVDTPGIAHAGNYSGARLSTPPGSLAPETVAKAIVRLARRPRNMTVVGAPALAFKLGELLTPNFGPAVMNGFMDMWAQHAVPGENGSGALFVPPAGPSGIHGGARRPASRRKAALAVGSIAALAATGIAAAWLHRRR